MTGVGRPTAMELQEGRPPIKPVAICDILCIVDREQDANPNRTQFNREQLATVFEYVFGETPPGRYSTSDLRRVLVYNAAVYAGIDADIDLSRYIMRHLTPSSCNNCTAPHIRLLHEYLAAIERGDAEDPHAAPTDTTDHLPTHDTDTTMTPTHDTDHSTVRTDTAGDETSTDQDSDA